MQVDNPIRQPSWDVGDLFHSDLFSANNNSNNTSHASTSSPSSSSSPGGNHSSISNASSPSSREVSPLPTPPSISLGEQFPEHHHHTAALAASSSSSNLQSPDALYGFYDSASSTSNNNNDARELLGATGPKSPGFMMNAFGAGAGGVGPPASNPYSFPMDDADFNAYMTGLEETYGITTNPAASNAGTSPASSSSSGTSPQQQQHQQQQGQTHTQTQQQQQGMEMMYGFNNMDLEMMSLPMSLDGAFGSMNGSNNPYAGMPMMGMSIDPADSMVMGLNMNIGIDPQLVDSPAPLVVMDDDDESPSKEEEEEEGEDGDDEEESEETAAPVPAKRGRKKKVVVVDTTTATTRRSARKSNDSSSPTSPTSDKEKLTLTIAPVKVGGRGTALGRRGTVMSGGVSKRGAVAGNSLATSALGSGLSSSSISTPLSERSNTPAPAAPAKRGRKPGPKKAAAAEQQEETTTTYAAQDFPVTSTSGLPVLPAPTSLPTTSSAPTHARTASTSKSTAAKAGGAGPGVPHSSSGLGIVPPPLPNGQKHLTPVDLGLGKTFAFAIPMGTFSGGVSGVVPPAGGPSAPGTTTTSPASSTSAAQAGNASSTNNVQQTPASQRAMSEFGDDLDEEGNAGGAYPADWRPSPEVFAKMSSKEKRQLRNKISARNFRVRRKEYISTLEGDIAERDRLLEAIRNELGSSRNENLALRREVENLKRVLIDGRGVDASADGSLDHLPPPAPLPEKSAAEVLAAQAAAASSPSSSSNNALFKPNTQKDLPTSPRNGANSFWGGNAGGMNGMFGSNGVTAVHTTFVPAPVVVGLGGANMGGLSPNMGVYGAAWNQPSPFAPALQENISSPFAPALQENMNPLMRASGENQRRERETMKKGSPAGEQKENSFEGFADSNMFTMKNMDAYRMHLWGKMAAQYHAHHHQQQQQPRAIAPSSPPQLPQQQTQEATTNVYHPNLLQLQQLAHQQQQLVQQQALYQQQLQYQQQQGLAAKMGVGRTWFLTPSSASTPGSTPSDTRLPLGSTTNVPLGTTNNLVALLSGKGSVLGSGGYTGASFKRHPPKSVGGDKENGEQQKNQLELAKKQQEQAQAAMLAVVASQTILRKLGQAFWDAFSGSTSASASSQGGLAKRFEAPRSTSGPGQQYQTSSNQARPDWDADKVRKVLDGTAVLRIVDVDQLHKLEGPSARPVVNRSATTIPASSTLSRTAPSSTPSSTIMSKVPSIKEEPSSSSLANCPWTQCSREWCSTDTLRNVSKGGSVSVPGSPVVRAVGPATAMGVSTSCGSSTLVGGLSGKTDAAKEEQNRKMASLLEEGMKGLRL